MLLWAILVYLVHKYRDLHKIPYKVLKFSISDHDLKPFFYFIVISSNQENYISY